MGRAAARTVAAGAYFKDHIRVGDTLGVSAPRGTFVLAPGDDPVVLISAGIGITPMLAMLHALGELGSTRHVLWIHAARDRAHHPFVDEVKSLLSNLAHARSFVCYSRPGADDGQGVDFDAAGRLSQSRLASIGMPRDAQAYICGPASFMSDVSASLEALGLRRDRIQREAFGGGNALNPGIVGESARAPHLPDGDANTGPTVSFARSGITAHWNPGAYQNVLELAEACDVPVRWSCRAGVCHNCETGLISGAVSYDPDPLDPPFEGNVLICCSRPSRDVVLDL